MVPSAVPTTVTIERSLVKPNALSGSALDRVRSVTLLDTSFRLADPRPFLAEAEEGIEAL
jgi:hypothetical protein